MEDNPLADTDLLDDKKPRQIPIVAVVIGTVMLVSPSSPNM